MLEKDKDNFPSHLNYDLIELPTELFQVSKKNKKALTELGSDAKRMNSGLKKKGKASRISVIPCNLQPLASLMDPFYLSARPFIILLLQYDSLHLQSYSHNENFLINFCNFENFVMPRNTRIFIYDVDFDEEDAENSIESGDLIERDNIYLVYGHKDISMVNI